MQKGIITSAQPESTEAGADMLKAGGNAVDAAMACALVAGVVDPMMTGVAGFGSLHLKLPSRGVEEVIGFHGKVPSAAKPDMWAHLIEGETRDGFGFILKGRVNDVGYQAITVPGSLKAYFEAHRDYGRLPWKTICQPAIQYAEKGWAVRPHVAYWWSRKEQFGRTPNPDRLRATPACARLYCDADGNPLDIGAWVRNPDLARTLRRIADEGADVFYTGDIARAIDADMKAHGGLMRYEDLAGYRLTRDAPMRGTYRGYDIATCPPPGGGIMLVEMLNVLENFDLAGLGHNSANYIRVVAEAMKMATSDKDNHVGDPAFVDVPVARLTDKAYAKTLAERIRAGDRAHVERLNDKIAEAAQTTHVCVVDVEGNAVSMTHSLGMPSGVVSEGLGFVYNGCMGVFDPRPGRAGSLAPGKSRFSSLCPTLVSKDGELKLVIGAPGGTQIVMGVMQSILNVIDFGMPILDAVSAARFSATSDTIDVMNRIPRAVEAELEADGYAVARNPLSYGLAAVHGLLNTGGKWTGAADPGHDGMPMTV